MSIFPSNFILLTYSGAGDRKLTLGDDVFAVDCDDIFPGYSMDEVDFTVRNMHRLDQDIVVPGKSVKFGDVNTMFEYRSWLNNKAISS